MKLNPRLLIPMGLTGLVCAAFVGVELLRTEPWKQRLTLPDGRRLELLGSDYGTAPRLELKPWWSFAAPILPPATQKRAAGFGTSFSSLGQPASGGDWN